MREAQEPDTKEPTEEVSGADLQVVNQLHESLDELADIIEKSYFRIASIRGLVKSDVFKYISKGARNTMLTELMDSSADIMDGTKNIHKLLRKIKRERPPEAIVDKSLIDNSDNEIG